MVILASASPQRKTLLRQIGIVPLVVPTDIDEKLDTGDIISSLEKLAEDKVAAALNGLVGCESAISGDDCWIIGADTVILLEAAILGKPQDSEDAVRMLRALSGRTHRVATGICVGKLEKPGTARLPPRHVDPGGALPRERTDEGGAHKESGGADSTDMYAIANKETDVVVTSVTFKSLSEKEISWYVATGEWRNAAGAYRIQGKAACLTTSINGSFSNVVGLPLEQIYGILIKLGYVF